MILLNKRTLFIDDCDPIVHVRLQLLRLQMCIEIDADFEMANELLNHINTYFIDATPQIECIRLPNQIYCKLIDRWIIGSEMKLIKCLQQLQQFKQQQWQQWQMHPSTLELLLTHRQCNFESKYLNSSQQMEMLVEWHWYAKRFDECLYWCEIGLNEAIRNWMQRNNGNDSNDDSDGSDGDKPVSNQFLQHIRFFISHLEHFHDENPNGTYRLY